MKLNKFIMIFLFLTNSLFFCYSAHSDENICMTNNIETETDLEMAQRCIINNINDLYLLLKDIEMYKENVQVERKKLTLDWKSCMQKRDADYQPFGNGCTAELNKREDKFSVVLKEQNFLEKQYSKITGYIFALKLNVQQLRSSYELIKYKAK